MKARARRSRLRALPVNSLIPNMLTVVSLCAGLTAIRFALESRWELAAAAIVLAGIMDGLDGRLARILKGTTRFGAELDSLSDFISFGIAPVVLAYMWSLEALGGVGWIVVLGYSVCCALRLARFNTSPEAEGQAVWAVGFFVGLPAPAAAGFILLPLIATFQFGLEWPRLPWLLAPYVVLVSALMVSRIPAPSFKRIRIRREHVLPLLLVVGLGVAALTSYPWVTLGVVGLSYALSIPVAAYRYSVLARRNVGIGPESASPASEARPRPSDGTAETESDQTTVH